MADTAASSASPSHSGAHSHGRHHHRTGALALTLGALGVVYGDIGTSPLYALRECFHGPHAVAPTQANVYGVLSLFVWTLTLVIVVKYLGFVTRADNGGEGGTLALLALALPKRGARPTVLVLMGLFGTSLLCSEGMLTPAISVLSAVEGIGGVAHGMQRFVVPLALVIIVVLFLAQKRGTGRVGAVFGPVMVVWFVTLGAMGIYWIAQHPEILGALSPHHAVSYFVRNGLEGFWILGSVVLCITGGEALYADLGHFGRTPIRNAWFSVVMPGLILNYFGQGAMLLEHPERAEDSFYGLVGDGFRIPLVLLATLATVIASQALISGTFSLTRQAIQLGYLPRLEVRHTSSETEGQIYVPEMNRLLMVACIALVLVFQTSSSLAAAYGMSVMGTMTITSVLFFIVARRWWGATRAGVLCALMLAVDIPFLLANVDKLPHGGWFPIATAAVMLAILTTWKAGRDRVGRFLRERSRPLDEFLDEVDAKDPLRVPGTAVFMTSQLGGTPPVLLHHFKHNKVLHHQVVLLSVVTDDVPTVPRSQRVKVERLRENFFQVTAHYGFMQSPRVTDILRACHEEGLHTKPEDTSFYLGREKLVITKNPGLAHWRKVLFSFLSRNARPATDFFRLPPDRVVEMGMQLEL
ncbi:potassium transporter Kup [Sandaracinus amylolyticus]|uniref:Probable potassium transport system protein Kup n=1 Tax=Sandaracinus amylolyticus TaxID=927083 RepID=A0A0F6YI35_9BACT|nr:potassium transporter Kup [Sandaracinus amylolyticus]AKF06547.1 Kup system potassium uptake protein [Sandaracinus amylolyticus]